MESRKKEAVLYTQSGFGDVDKEWRIETRKWLLVVEESCLMM
jgi:hypothetical protein